MSSGPAQFPFVARDVALGAASMVPLLPITLDSGSVRIKSTGRLDTGATVNVLPYSAGLQLGLDWDHLSSVVQLSGNLASVEARVVILNGVVSNFPLVRLAFAWAKSDVVPLLLGQVNFFLEFDVCFFRARNIFEIKPKHTT